MPKTESPQPQEEAATEKPKPKAKRLTVKSVWTEVDAVKQQLAALDSKATSLGQALEGLGPKVDGLRAQPGDSQGAQQMASLSTGVQSLNGNYLRQVEELSNLRKGLEAMGSKVDSLAAGTKLVEESCGELSIEVDAVKENVEKASKKVEGLEASISRLEGSLKRGFWMAGLVVGAVVIVAVVAAIFLL